MGARWGVVPGEGRLDPGHPLTLIMETAGRRVESEGWLEVGFMSLGEKNPPPAVVSYR